MKKVLIGLLTLLVVSSGLQAMEGSEREHPAFSEDIFMNMLEQLPYELLLNMLEQESDPQQRIFKAELLQKNLKKKIAKKEDYEKAVAQLTGVIKKAREEMPLVINFIIDNQTDEKVVFTSKQNLFLLKERTILPKEKAQIAVEAGEKMIKKSLDLPEGVFSGLTILPMIYFGNEDQESVSETFSFSSENDSLDIQFDLLLKKVFDQGSLKAMALTEEREWMGNISMGVSELLFDETIDFPKGSTGWPLRFQVNIVLKGKDLKESTLELKAITE